MLCHMDLHLLKRGQSQKGIFYTYYPHFLLVKLMKVW